MDIDKEIRAYVLQNSIKFKGKANPGAVIGKIFALDPALKSQAKDISIKIQAVIKEISDLSVGQQQEELKSLAPELLEKKKKEERNIFAFLGYKETDTITTAFPPGPEKYPHIGHAKTILLNYLLAKQYNGKMILRFEDTNPATAKAEYYDIMLENFKWLGIDPAEVIYASDHMDFYYEKALDLIKKGFAYVEQGSADEIKLSREKGVATPSREQPIEKNVELWSALPTMNAGSAIVRLKIDLKHQNTTMRDPTIFRLIDNSHPRTGEKYRLWPTYDFQNAIMDSYSHIDIRLRSKEFELRAELQRWLQEKVGMDITKTYEFGRFNMSGVESSGRIIREKVESGELIGWDDPTLTTLVALRRRGFLPQAITNFVLSTGISKAEATMTWDDLIHQNKKLLDDSAKRYSAIMDPIEITIQNAPNLDVELHLSPNEKKGGRKHSTTDTFILSKKDVDELNSGDHVRLMDCLNARKEGDQLIFDSLSFEDFKGKRIINWLTADNVAIEVFMTDKTTQKGFAEKHILDLSEGDVIQFERFGFCRLDSKDKNTFWYTHK